jgi:hypothetical protein
MKCCKESKRGLGIQIQTSSSMCLYLYHMNNKCITHLSINCESNSGILVALVLRRNLIYGSYP